MLQTLSASSTSKSLALRNCIKNGLDKSKCRMLASAFAFCFSFVKYTSIRLESIDKLFNSSMFSTSADFMSAGPDRVACSPLRPAAYVRGAGKEPHKSCHYRCSLMFISPLYIYAVSSNINQSSSVDRLSHWVQISV